MRRKHRIRDNLKIELKTVRNTFQKVTKLLRSLIDLKKVFRSVHPLFVVYNFWIYISTFSVDYLIAFENISRWSYCYFRLLLFFIVNSFNQLNFWTAAESDWGQKRSVAANSDLPNKPSEIDRVLFASQPSARNLLTTKIQNSTPRPLSYLVGLDYYHNLMGVTTFSGRCTLRRFFLSEIFPVLLKKVNKSS